MNYFNNAIGLALCLTVLLVAGCAVGDKQINEAFVKRAVEYAHNGRLCVMLLPVSTSTVLFHEWIKPNAKEIRFLRGRVKFEGVNTFGERVTNKAGMHDSMIVVLGI